MNRYQLSKQEVPQLPYDMFPEIDNRIIDVINRFLKQKVAAGYSRYTLLEYIYIFPRFFEKCNKWPLTEITSYDIAIWKEKFIVGKVPSTTRAQISRITALFSFFQSEKLITRNPVTKRLRIKCPPSQVMDIPADEMARIMIVTESLSIRDRTLICLLHDAGIRRKEILGLMVADIDWINSKITVYGKRNKKRALRISESVLYLIRELIEFNHTKGCDNGFVFLGNTGNPLQPECFRLVVKSVGQKAKVKGKFHSNRFRHLKATTLMESGYGIKRTQAYMGHSWASTTMIYIHIQETLAKYYYDKGMNNYDTK